MALIQNGLMHFFQKWTTSAIGSVAQIDQFSWVTLGVAYALIAAIMAVGWLRSRLATIELVFVSLAVVAIWPLTRYYYFLFAPDYWIYEIPFYLVSCFWFLCRQRSLETSKPAGLGLSFFLLVGFWTGLAFLQKPSIAAYAALPAVLEILYVPRSARQRAVGLLVTLSASAASHWFFFRAYFHFESGIGQTAYRHYWDWLIHHPETGTSLLTLPQLISSANFLLVPIGLGVTALLAVTGLAVCRSPLLTQPRLALISFLWVVIAAHLCVIGKRPSGTSVMDLMFYSVFLLPVLFGLFTPTGRKQAFGIAGSAMILGCITYRPLPFGARGSDQSASILATIERVRLIVDQTDRPVILLLPDNRLHPYTREAFGLYTGQMNQHGHAYDERNLPRPFPPESLRGRLFPSAFMLGKMEQDKLAAAIAAGYLIMWGEASSMPPITEYFPAIASLIANPACEHIRFSILPGDVVIAHIAFRRDISLTSAIK